MASNDEAILMLMSMGFDSDQSHRALADCGGNVERAIDNLLGGGGVGGDSAGSSGGNGDGSSGGDVTARAVHCDVSQYDDPSVGRSACTSIALLMARRALDALDVASDSSTPVDVAIDSAFLAKCIREGVRLHRDVGSAGSGVEHTSVEEILVACRSGGAGNAVVDLLDQLPSSPRQGILSNSPDNPMGLEAVLCQCQLDAPDPTSYVAAVITKPPETILVLLSPCAQQSGSGASYVLLDSHPRPQQLVPHCPRGSYALFHSSLRGLVGSLSQIFPAVELGPDVSEMMAMMYNSFDVYPFQLTLPDHRKDSQVLHLGGC